MSPSHIMLQANGGRVVAARKGSKEFTHISQSHWCWSSLLPFPNFCIPLLLVTVYSTSLHMAQVEFKRAGYSGDLVFYEQSISLMQQSSTR